MSTRRTHNGFPITVILALFSGLGMPFPVMAQGMQSPWSGSLMLEILTGLALVVVLIYATRWVLSRTGINAQNGRQIIRVITSINLGTRDRLALIELDGQRILIGISQSGIQSLHNYISQNQIDSKDDETPTIVRSGAVSK